ncbi:kinase-like domain-containing protein, partial [Scleroderma citrinum]
NVLVSDDGRALLTNFSCSAIPSSDKTLVPSVTGYTKWTAPEHVDNGSSVSAEGDVWSFAMTVLELCTAEPPFKGITQSAPLLKHIICGPLPERPSCMTDDWWELCTSCWKWDPGSRPRMSVLVNKIEKVSIQFNVLVWYSCGKITSQIIAPSMRPQVMERFGRNEVRDFENDC